MIYLIKKKKNDTLEYLIINYLIKITKNENLINCYCFTGFLKIIIFKMTILIAKAIDFYNHCVYVYVCLRKT